MKKKTIIIIAVCVLVAVFAVVIITSNGEKVKPFSLEEIQTPELNAPGGSDLGGSISPGAPDDIDHPTDADSTVPGEMPSQGDNNPESSQESTDSTGTASTGTNDPAEATAQQETNPPSTTLPSEETSVSNTPSATEGPVSPTPSTPDSGTQTGTYKVTFVDRDNTVLSTQTVKEGQSAIPPIPPAHDDAVFLKWDKVLSDIRADRTIKAEYHDVSAPTISLENVYIDISQKTVSVKVSIYNNPGLSSLLLSISYPPGLTLQKIDFDKRFGEYVTAAEPYKSPQSISVVSPFSNIQESGVFATLTFSFDSSISVNQFTLNLSYDPDNTFDASYEEVGFTVFDGTITRIS